MTAMVEDASPRVTVFMPVYNGEAYLVEALDSILAQTYRDFELLVIDDGSRDGSSAILEGYVRRDQRIRVVRNDINRGLAYTRNRGISLAHGCYIVNMDCDDISLPHRLEKQVSFMDKHPDIGVCGSWYEIFLENKVVATMKYPVDSDTIKVSLFGNCVMANPSVIIRKNIIDRYGLAYNDEYKVAEDYAFWRDALLSGVKFYNLDEVLLRYRSSSKQTTRLQADKMDECLCKVRKGMLNDLGLIYSDQEFALHNGIMARDAPRVDKGQMAQAGEWLEQIRLANKQLQIYPEPSFSLFLAQKWFRLCYQQASKDTSVFPAYYKHQFRKQLPLPLGTKVRLLLKHLKGSCKTLISR